MSFFLHSLRRPPLLVPLACVALAWACSTSSGGAGGGNPSDAGQEADAPGADAAPDYVSPPPQDSSVRSCKYENADPVAFCFQKLLLQNELEGAYVKGQGVPPAWNAMGMPSGDHSWRDDVGFAASIGSYHCSSAEYADTELTPRLDAIMPDLGSIIVQELSTPPTGYDGEDYFRLRAASTALGYANDTMDAATVAQIAEAFGRNLQSTYAQTVTLPEGGTATVLGTPDGMGNVTYAPAQVIMGAAALVDLANLHAKDADAGSDVATWVQTALAAVDYVWSRGRDTTTGLFFQQLVTSADPDHDALGQGTPTPDALLSDVQAEAAFGLARLQDGVNALVAAGVGIGDASMPIPSPYANEANTIMQSMVTAGLFDGAIPTMPEAGIPNPAPAGAFMEALVPSTSAIDTNKTTLGNAWLLAAAHRVRGSMPTQLTDVIEPQLETALVQQTPAHSSLFTVLVDMQTGNPVQTDYLRASSKSFDLATAFSPDGGTGGPETDATSYRADAVAAVIESLTQLWRGVPSATPCAP